MTDVGARIPVPNAAIETAFLRDEAVLFDERDGTVHELSPSASAVWLLLDGETSIDDVVEELHELLGVERATLLADVPTVVDDFAAAGLLEGTERIEPDHDHDHAHEHGLGSALDDDTLRVLARPPDP